MEFDGFDWDHGNVEKCQKHGVAAAEIEELFQGLPLVGPDPYTAGERRFRAIGRNAAGRPIFAVFTWRLASGSRLIRPISARYMHKEEVDLYDKDIPHA